MAACGGLQQIFEKPLPENPTLLESLSPWNQIKPVKPADQSSFTEIFGELHFKDNSQSSSSTATSSFFPVSSISSPPSFFDLNTQTGITKLNNNDSLDNKYENKKRPSIFDSFSSTTPKNQYTTGSHKNSDSFSPMNHESLQLCTEGLGFESSDDVENLKNDINEDRQYQEEKPSITRHSTSANLSGECRRSRLSGGSFPPPISCIGKSGKPWVCFKSYRHDGRFVLKEVRIPTLEFLHACREDGRLKLQFVHPNDENFNDAEDEEEAEEENFTEYDEQENEEKVTMMVMEEKQVENSTHEVKNKCNR